MRIYKTRTLARFTRQNGIPDASLVAAVERAMRGLIDADLGGRIVKQRVARAGEGKRGGFRERENIEDAELKTLREIANTFLKADGVGIEQALESGVLIEVPYG